GQLPSSRSDVVLHQHVLIFPGREGFWILHVFQELVSDLREVEFVSAAIFGGNGDPGALALLLDADSWIHRFERANPRAQRGEYCRAVSRRVWNHIELWAVLLGFLLAHLDLRLAAAINGHVGVIVRRVIVPQRTELYIHVFEGVIDLSVTEVIELVI